MAIALGVTIHLVMLKTFRAEEQATDVETEAAVG